MLGFVLCNLSPTDVKVVHETMIQAQKIANECGMKYMQVTYYLNIANIALRLQSQLKPKFDNIFIHLGPFHIYMAFFKAIGRFIDGSGLINIPVDCEFLASGSVDGFLAGKSYNRNKKLHPMMSLSLQILHIKFF